MKKWLFLISAVLFFNACEKSNVSPREENITKGSKWTLAIGSSPESVYAQLQELAEEKNFHSLSVVYRKPYSKPEDIKDLFRFYDAITIQSNAAVIQRTVIHFEDNKVKTMETGGGLLDSISAWPSGVSPDKQIRINDKADDFYDKLLAIYAIPTFDKYQLILPSKPLNKPFDPDMANFDEWAFTFFSEPMDKGKVGRNTVRLYFKNNQLSKIKNRFDEHQMVD